MALSHSKTLLNLNSQLVEHPSFSLTSAIISGVLKKFRILIDSAEEASPSLFRELARIVFSDNWSSSTIYSMFHGLVWFLHIRRIVRILTFLTETALVDFCFSQTPIAFLTIAHVLAFSPSTFPSMPSIIPRRGLSRPKSSTSFLMSSRLPTRKPSKAFQSSLSRGGRVSSCPQCGHNVAELSEAITTRPSPYLQPVPLAMTLRCTRLSSGSSCDVPASASSPGHGSYDRLV